MTQFHRYRIYIRMHIAMDKDITCLVELLYRLLLVHSVSELELTLIFYVKKTYFSDDVFWRCDLILYSDWLIKISFI